MGTARRVAACACAALLVAGCSSSSADPEPEPSTSSPTPTEAETTETPSPTPSATATESGDPFAMPDPVTEEYVDRVVNTLYEEWGAITREILEQPADPTAVAGPDLQSRLSELFAGQYLQRRIEEATDTLRGDRDGLLSVDEFGQLRFRTEALLDGTEDCLVAVGRLSFEETATSGGEELVAVSASPAADGSHSVGWRVVDLLANTDPDGNELPEEMMLTAETEDFGDSLDNSC